jgi:hypothetical protein
MLEQVFLQEFDSTVALGSKQSVHSFEEDSTGD